MRESMDEVLFLMNSRCECIWINTYEEQQVISDLRELVTKNFRSWKLNVWSNTEGLLSLPINKGEKAVPPDKKLREIPALFEHMRQALAEGDNSSGVRNQTGIIYVLRDLHNLMQDPRTRRCIRDLKEYRHVHRYLPIIVIAPSTEIHDEVSKLFRVVDYGLPTKAMIETYVDKANSRMKEKVEKENKEYYPISKSEYGPIVNACVGLTTMEIDSVLLRSMKKFQTFNLEYILRDKIESVKKSGLLDYKQPKIKLSDVGGHDVLKEYVNELKFQMTPEAREFGLEAPKGSLFLGVPGQGKTMMAEAIAGELGVPMLMLNMAHVMDRLVGNSEKKIENALEVAKSTAPCVMMLDEVEKMLGGINSSNNTDSGITARIFQSILKFLQDNDHGVYVIMTSNDVSQLPPEFTRTGRLDSQWFFDIPSPESREEIFKLYFSKYPNARVDDKVLKVAVEESQNFTGAEIKEAVKNIMRKAFIEVHKNKLYKGAEISVDAVKRGVSEVTPVFESNREKIQALRNWVQGRARFTDYREEDNDSDNNFDPFSDGSLTL